MTVLAEMEMIAAEAVDTLRFLTERLEGRLGREPTLNEVAQGLAISFGAARGALVAAGDAGGADALAQFVAIASDDAEFCLRGLREAGL